ncbi:uncharacterized protein LOC134311885 [Trichomycterus rosablanca]|uniref:uncharacterized protein LOC134311885 n=1 Tax=Trichomycterus rosablanca TaxID=2290929 RepID=UPI002F35235C
MSDTSTVRKAPPQAQSSGSGHTLMPKRQPEHFASKHVCFYKSGDAQFSGLPVVINKRTFKTFEGLLDSLSKRVPLPFGVRTITTPRGQTAVRSLDQLHHGHSYICSDKRTVKPIDLEQARRKPPPWYHARPVSSRRLASTRQSFGPRSAPWSEYAAMLHTPKWVVVFHNGAPDVKHTLLLHRRNTRSFKELMDLISEVMNFPVHKLHTVDGKKVNGLLALILCSGVLVASGREPFRKVHYNVQKPSAPAWLPAKSVGRLHHRTRKKTSLTSSTRSRPFSPSSERYIVNQLHNSFSENASNPTGSENEMKTGQHVDSVEADTMTCKDVTAEENICMPTNDDIEKSFRVNEDGSMTVEMKVRLTLKDEETVHWTTTLSRSTVANQIKSVSESHPDLGELLCDNIYSDVDSKALEINQMCPEEHREVSSKDCPQAAHENLEEGNTGQSIGLKVLAQAFPSSLGWCQIKQKQLPLGSTNNVSKTESQQNVLGFYTDKEETSNEQIKQEYCMVKHHPVPKPRNTMSCKLNSTSSQQQADTYKSAEILQLQDSGKKTVLHIVKQQTCQKSFLANTEFHAQGIDTCDICSTEDLSTKISTIDEPMQMGHCRETTSQESKKHTAEIPLVIKSAKHSAARMTSAAGIRRNKKPVRVIVKKCYRTRSVTLEHMRKDTKTDILKEINKIRAEIFSRSGVMKTMIKYYQAKAVYKLLKQRTNTANDHKHVCSTLPNAVGLKIQSTSKSFTGKESCTSEEHLAQTFLYNGKQNNNSTQEKNLLHISTNKSTLKRQTSMQDEQDFQRETCELRESASLPALHFSSSVLNERVELWLQKNKPEPFPFQKEDPPSKLHSLQVSEIASCGDLTCLASVDSSSRIVSLTKSLKEDASFSKKEMLPSDPCSERLSITRDSTQEKSSLCKNKNVKNDILLSDEETKSFQLNLPLNDDSTTEEPSINLIESFQSNPSFKNNMNESLNKISTVNDLLKQAPDLRIPSSKKTLISQDSIEKIPNNNTSSIASLFTNQGVEREPQSEIAISSESAVTYLEKSKASSASMNSSSQRDLGTGETDEDTISSANRNESTMLGKKSYTVKMAVRPDLRRVLDKLCYVIKSLDEETQHKCLEKPNSMSDFFSYLASTFGSSSQVLLAFLSIMTLKDSLETGTVQCQADDSSSCSEALLLILSLKEMASIENAEQLRSSLNDLQNSMSDQLLHNWRGFQELCNQSLNCSVTPKCNRSDSYSGPSCTEEAIQGLMEELGVPDRVREELAAICTCEERIRASMVEGSDKLCEALAEIELNKYTNPVLNKEMSRLPDSKMLEDDVSKYVSSVIEKAIHAHTTECDSSNISMVHSLVSAKDQIKVEIGKRERNVCPISNSDTYKKRPSSRSALIEQHQGVKKQDVKSMREKESNVVEQRHNEEQDIYKDRAIYDDSVVIARRTLSGIASVQDDYIVEDNPKCSETQDSNNKKDDVQNQSQINKVWATKKGSTFSESSNSEDRLATSLEEEEDDNCDEEYMDFSEDTEQKHSFHGSTNCQRKSMASQEQSQLYSKRDHLKGPPEMKSTLTAIHVGSHMKKDMRQNKQKRQQVKTSHFKEEQVIVEVPECYMYEEHLGDQKEYGLKEAVVCEKNTPQTKKYLVAELINNMESFTQQTSNKPESHVNRFTAQTEVSEPLETLNLTSETLPSSLTFSYESLSSSLAQEQERTTHVNRVKSIREMFLAKSNTNTQNKHSQNSDHSESIDCGENWSQRSPETSSGEDDTCHLAIAKGFVRRTIERIYGRGNMNSTGPDDIRPQSASQRKRRAGPGRTNVTNLASFHEARARLISDLSYFSATSSCDVLNAPTHGQVELRDANLPDKDHCKKGKKNTTILTEPLQNSMTADSHNNDSLATKISYFNLPNASDSELESEEQKSDSTQTEIKVPPEPQMLKPWAEKNSFLPVFSPPAFKKADNKVHPLTEALTSPVVSQPVSRQSAQTGVVRHSTEPDLLEMLFIFCGQHCPVL